MVCPVLLSRSEFYRSGYPGIHEVFLDYGVYDLGNPHAKTRNHLPSHRPSMFRLAEECRLLRAVMVFEAKTHAIPCVYYIGITALTSFLYATDGITRNSRRAIQNTP